MAKRIIFKVKGLELPAVLVDYQQSTVDLFDNTYHTMAIVYCQNKLAKRVKYYSINPENGVSVFNDMSTCILADYCVIPEYDELLK